MVNMQWPRSFSRRAALAFALGLALAALVRTQPDGAEKKSAQETVAGLLAGAAIAFFLILAVGAIFFLRKRGGTKTAVGSVACPKCARILKTTGELAGKKVKCARCGTVVLVPETTVSDG